MEKDGVDANILPRHRHRKKRDQAGSRGWQSQLRCSDVQKGNLGLGGGGGSLGAERGCEEGKTCLLLAFEPFSPAASSLLLRIQALEAGLASKAKTCSFPFTVQTLQKDQQSEAGVFGLGSTAAAQVQGSSTIRAGPGGREVGGRAGCSPSARCGRGGCPRTSLSGLR